MSMLPMETQKFKTPNPKPCARSDRLTVLRGNVLQGEADDDLRPPKHQSLGNGLRFRRGRYKKNGHLLVYNIN